jgi:hypothetical protein
MKRPFIEISHLIERKNEGEEEKVDFRSDFTIALISL